MTERIDPINAIEWRQADSLKANYWNPNRVYKPELRLLERSILATGWIQPILINKNNLIIDGFHRWRLTLDSKRLRKEYNGTLPVAVLAVEDDEAMAITVRINRAKGTHVAVEMHNLVLQLAETHQWTTDRIASEIGATKKEVDLLLQEGVFTAKKIREWSYSQAWYPGETKFDDKAG